ncbi:MAG: transpeptidase family protein [Acidobacteria bacterium]|nr:transpeptidase family protein [Acidobacteriota bacterium]
MPSKSKTPKNRLRIIQLLIIVWLLAICARLVWLQVKEYPNLSARAERQQQASIPLTPMRGVIYDRNGNELARSSEVKSLYAYPNQITDAQLIAPRLAKILDLDKDELLKRLKASDKVCVAIKRKLSDQEVAQVDALNLQGLRYVNEMKRQYLNGTTAAHVLGFVDVDEKGLSGLERYFDQTIRGQEGKMTVTFDALKKPFDHEIEKSVQGANIHLTLDATIQHYAEKALREGIRRSNARGGTLVMMKPATGEILALASYPTFDPNDVSDSTDLQKRNRAIETAFEPGSIFKIVAYSAALEEKLITPNTLINCGNGTITINGQKIQDTHPHSSLTATQALAQSSNVAAIIIGQKLGYERLAQYIERFGFGQRTKIELPAESRGILTNVKHWTPTIPIGYGISVTAVQAAAAFSCIANGGTWVQPHLVKQITSTYGEIISEPQGERHRVISPDTAATLTSMLEGVVVRGTAKAAKIEGYRAAGKTGTSKKANGKHGYMAGKYVASFAGFAPVENPEIVCIVSIDEPVGAYFGGDVAAPIFAQAVSHALQIMGVAPENAVESSFVAGGVKTFEVPQLVDERPLLSQTPAANQGVAQAAKASSAPPTPNAEAPANHNPNREADDKEAQNVHQASGEILVPDLNGRGIREALALCASRGLKLQANGEGIVSGQSPPPGTYVTKEVICRVRLVRTMQKKSPPARDPKKPPAAHAQATATRAQ